MVSGLYLKILSELSRGSRVVYCNADPETARKTFQSVVREHPELFWVSSDTCGVTSVGLSVTLYPAFWGAPEKTADRRRELNDAVSGVLRFAPRDMTDYDKILWAHDLIVNNTEYVYEVFRGDGSVKSSDELSREGIDYAFGAYGCLVRRRAVCSGYAAGLQLLLRKLGVPCDRVSGRIRVGPHAGRTHAWNRVTLDGMSCFVDATWDDLAFSGANVSQCSHEYFCIGAQDLSRTHMPDEGLKYTAHTPQDYYSRNGLFFPEYRRAAVARVLKSFRFPGIAELKFGSESECRRAMDDLLKNPPAGLFYTRRFPNPALFTGNGGKVLSIIPDRERYRAPERPRGF